MDYFEKISKLSSQAMLFKGKDEIKIPMQCSQCGNTGKQNVLFSFITIDDEDYDGVAITFCEFCNKTTVHFLELYNMNALGDRTLISKSSIPTYVSDANFNADFRNEFSDFVKIYSQSQIAESTDLNLIAGMGYRKSVEYLITDYLKNFSDEDPTWIDNPKTTFGDKIKKLKNPKLQTLAQAISWIGNDETHPVKRHPDYDIQNMKNFINALVATIESEIEVNKAIEFTSHT